MRAFVAIPKYWATCKGLRSYNPKDVIIKFAGVTLVWDDVIDYETVIIRAPRK
jgi:hypothetical protein